MSAADLNAHLLPAERLRAVPQQARSRGRVIQVLDAAKRVLATEGSDALTTTRVAREAGLAVGSLYRYFPDIAAIVDAVAGQYLSELEALMEEFVRQATELREEEVVGTLVAAYADYYRQHPGFRALWFGRHLTEDLRAKDRAHKRAMGEGLRRLVLAAGLVPPGAADDRLDVAAYAAVLASDALIQEAFRADPQGDPALLAETEALLRGYLLQVLGASGGRR